VAKEKVTEEEIKKAEETTEVEQEVIEEDVNMTKKIEEKENEVKDYVDRLQRTMAEFDNFRKRTIKEKSMMYEKGAKETLEKLLPVIDNFERAIDSLSDEEKELPFTQGVEMIFKQLVGTFKELGVEVMDAEGKEFDPNFHHAVTHAEDEEFGENIVSEVFQKGYMYNDSVLRPSMVKVVN
jgi:molecular chaperone GrpE